MAEPKKPFNVKKDSLRVPSGSSQYSDGFYRKEYKMHSDTNNIHMQYIQYNARKENRIKTLKAHNDIAHK